MQIKNTLWSLISSPIQIDSNVGATRSACLLAVSFVKANSIRLIGSSQVPNDVIEDSTIDRSPPPSDDVESVPGRSVVENRKLR
jgi:hypothetical protein